MKTTALMYAPVLEVYAFENVPTGRNAFQMCQDFAANLPDITTIFVAQTPLQPLSHPFQSIIKSYWDVPALLDALVEAGRGADLVYYFWADCPLLDLTLTRTLLKHFIQYRAEYAFADGYPQGVCPELIAPHILPSLQKLYKRSQVERQTIFQILEQDINSFDIETLISSVDLRDLRLSFSCDSKRNKLLLDTLISAGVQDAKSALEIIPGNASMLRTLPSYISVQISAACLQICSLCPYPKMETTVISNPERMSLAHFEDIMNQVECLCGDAVINLSLWGEPSTHPNFDALVASCMARKDFSLIIETSGLGWDKNLVSILVKNYPNRIDWIISLDALSPQLYKKLRGDGYNEAISFVNYMLEICKDKTHVQFVRTNQNEEELQPFWQTWTKRTSQVIIQKYSTYASFLPQYKVSDLSPIKRKPCWHIKRDISILINGDIPLCRECVKNQIVLGNAFTLGGISEAWERGKEYYKAHIIEEYPACCQNCDEYYTYNA